MRIGTSYKHHPGLADHWDAIVIGSGIGGLSVAATIAKLADKRVLVLERHYTAGGFTHTFRRPGYEWDVGVHYIGDVSDPRGSARGYSTSSPTESSIGPTWATSTTASFSARIRTIS